MGLRRFVVKDIYPMKKKRLNPDHMKMIGSEIVLFSPLEENISMSFFFMHDSNQLFAQTTPVQKIEQQDKHDLNVQTMNTHYVIREVLS